ncbi:MAG: 50S ribosomal protein L22 [Spirochaetes bacterium]|nr:MAG: 50S ribosomal protein L22 [Spirochaetota bacterium]
MQARALAKYLRVSWRKVRKYTDLVKNMSYKEAHTMLKLSPSRGANMLARVMESAVANLIAKNKNIDEDTVKIESVIVNEGPVLKRWKPRARGRADRIRKRTCHIEVVVSGEEIKK